jgi:hypothetical protein
VPPILTVNLMVLQSQVFTLPYTSFRYQAEYACRSNHHTTVFRSGDQLVQQVAVLVTGRSVRRNVRDKTIVP